MVSRKREALGGAPGDGSPIVIEPVDPARVRARRAGADKVVVRLTSAERAQVESEADALGVSMSDVIRLRLSDDGGRAAKAVHRRAREMREIKATRIFNTVPIEARESFTVAADEITAIRVEARHVGRNVNQIAHAHNVNRRCTEVDREAFAQMAAKFEEFSAAVDRAASILESIGHGMTQVRDDQ